MEVQRQKDANWKQKEEKRFDMANRIKNIEIDRERDKLEKLELSKQKANNRSFLDIQIKERASQDKAEKQDDLKCSGLDYDKEDKFFFNYAKTILTDAEKKDRNTYPITKAIQKYKKDRGIDIEKNTPPHLLTHLTMGRNDIEKPDTPKVRYGIDELKRLESNFSCVCCNRHIPRK